MGHLKSKLDSCRRSLIEWSKNQFKNNIHEIHKAKQRLRWLGKSNMSQEEENEERDLKSRINALWKRDEIYWKQRPRLKCLMHGDRNTKYFYQTTLARRCGNKNLRLKGTGGEWIEGDRV